MREKKETPVVIATSVPTSTRFSEPRSAMVSDQDTEPSGGLQEKISLFTRVQETVPDESITVLCALERIRSGFYRASIERLRPLATEAEAARDLRDGRGAKSSAEKAYDALKCTLPSVTWSGTFSKRRESGLVSHSGILCLDVDHLRPNEVEEVMNGLRADPVVLFAFRSPSYHGLKIGVRIDGSRHKQVWSSVESYFRQCYGLQVDSACRDVSRLCFVSFDPDLFVNTEASIFRGEPVVDPDRPPSSLAEVRELLNHIPSRPHYPEWIRIIAAVGDALPEEQAVAALCEWSPEERAGEYREKLRSRLTRVKRGTLFFLARRYGWKPRSQGTRQSVRNADKPPASSTNRSRLVVKSVSQIEARPTEWLWTDLIPFGHLTICEGDPGIGKSTILNADIPARLSTGTALPLEKRAHAPMSILLLSAEDDEADTIKPRLLAAGADVDRVKLARAWFSVDSSNRAVDLGRDIAALRDTIREESTRLVVIDPLSAFLGDVETYKESSVRGVLTPLNHLAQETGAAIVAIRHWSKTGNQKSTHRGLGSIGFSAVTRSLIQFARHPSKDGTFVIALAKGNLAKKEHSITYRIESRTAVVNGHEISTSGILWSDSSNLTAEELSSETYCRDERFLQTEIAQFLLTELEAGGGIRKAVDMIKLGNRLGFSSTAMARARSKLGIRSRKIGGPSSGGSQWVWVHPDYQQAESKNS